MAHKFDIKQLKKLDNAERRSILPPVETLKLLGLSLNDTLIDIGAGIGYFTIPITCYLSKNNPIYALDTSQEMLEYLVEREKEINGDQRITVVKTEEYDFKLPHASGSYALLVNVLHEIDDKERFLRAISDLLTANSKLAIIEWLKKEMPSGPPLAHRLGEEDVASLLHSQGFKIINTHYFGENFYGIVAEKGASL